MLGTTWIWTASGGALMVLGLMVLAANARDRVHRAFALLVVLEGARQVFRLFAGDIHEARWALALGRMTAYTLLARPFLVAYLWALLQARFRGQRLPPWVGWSILAAVAVLEASYLLTRAAWMPRAAFVLSDASTVALGLLLLAEALRQEATGVRRALTLCGAAFCFFPLAFTVHVWIPDLMSARKGWPVVQDALVIAAEAMAVAVLLRLRRAIDRRVADQARVGLVLLAVAALSALALAPAQALLSPAAFKATMVATMTLWYLGAFVVLGYAILRGAIFGMEQKLRLTVSRGMVGASFVAVFFVAAKLVEAAVGAFFGSQWLVGAVAAGLLLFAMNPLQAMAERFTNGVMPKARPVAHMSARQREAAYREQAELAWADRAMGLKERRMLDGAARVLGLSAAQAGAIEERVVAALAHGPGAAVLKRAIPVQQD